MEKKFTLLQVLVPHSRPECLLVNFPLVSSPVDPFILERLLVHVFLVFPPVHLILVHIHVLPHRTPGSFFLPLAGSFQTDFPLGAEVLEFEKNRERLNHFDKKKKKAVFELWYF